MAAFTAALPAVAKPAVATRKASAPAAVCNASEAKVNAWNIWKSEGACPRRAPRAPRRRDRRSGRETASCEPRRDVSPPPCRPRRLTPRAPLLQATRCVSRLRPRRGRGCVARAAPYALSPRLPCSPPAPRFRLLRPLSSTHAKRGTARPAWHLAWLFWDHLSLLFYRAAEPRRLASRAHGAARARSARHGAAALRGCASAPPVERTELGSPASPRRRRRAQPRARRARQRHLRRSLPRGAARQPASLCPPRGGPPRSRSLTLPARPVLRDLLLPAAVDRCRDLQAGCVPARRGGLSVCRARACRCASAPPRTC